MVKIFDVFFSALLLGIFFITSDSFFLALVALQACLVYVVVPYLAHIDIRVAKLERMIKKSKRRYR